MSPISSVSLPKNYGMEQIPKQREPSKLPKTYKYFVLDGQKPRTELSEESYKSFVQNELGGFKKNVTQKLVDCIDDTIAQLKRTRISMSSTLTEEKQKKPEENSHSACALRSPYTQNVKPRMNWVAYHRLNVIYDFMDQLESDNPATCTVGCIGKSLEGRPIKLLKISNSAIGNPAVWIDAGIHAREWIAPAVATYLAKKIAHNFSKQPPSITNKDWFILPVMNPDGYEYSHTNERMWRKNKAHHGGQLVGVDLNRNFSLGWGCSGSSDTPNHAFFRGPCAFSEPESRAVRDFLLNPNIPFKIYITLHSYGQVIIFPLSYKDDLCPDYMKLLEGATAMSKAIYNASGYIYKVGISRDVMYSAAGTSHDWSYGQAKIPFCYLIELRSKKHKFKLPQEEIEVTCKEILSCVRALVEFVDECDKPKNTKKDRKKKRCKVAPPKKKTQVWEVRFVREGQRYFVKSLDTRGAINIWKEERSTMEILVEASRATQVASMLHEREIPYSVAVPDVGLLMEKEQGILSSIARRSTTRKETISSS